MEPFNTEDIKKEGDERIIRKKRIGKTSKLQQMKSQSIYKCPWTKVVPSCKKQAPSFEIIN